MTTMAPPAQRAWLLRLGELRFRVFSGVPVVEVSPEQWGLDAATVRQAAAGRRYREVPSAQAGTLRFEFAPGFFPPPFHPGPGTDADRRRLAALLAREDQFWASLRRLRLSRADVGAVAAAAGMAVVAEVADPTDRLVLLRRPGLPDEELRPRSTQRITRRHVSYVIAGVFATCIAGGVLWVKLTQQALGPMLLIAGAGVFVAAAALVMRVVAGRSPRLPWLDAPFDGTPEVPVPFPASLSTELLGEVASLYGYFYGGPFVAGRSGESFLFVKCRPGLVFGHPAPAAAPAFDLPAESPGREQWLRNHLDGRDELWVSVRHAKLSPARIAEIAGRDGLVPVAEFADTTDRILLLRRPSAPPSTHRFRMSFVGFLAPAAWIVLCFGGSGLTSALTGDPRIFTIGFGLTVLGVPPLLWVLRAFPRSTRVGWLAGEFTGKPGVTFFSGQFDISPELVRQIAGYHGYFFGSQTSTRAQGTLVTYVKRG
ncbi:hypothetical protein [Amycolatopsis australiensis]|uniref:Uncharacterized protein n=1 Tax=Amycolatopsis australiensis TaxID=546364 RepID=A0A1K1QR66_9PSEU|nr:hypothetical protein [Amycolatopsis australiensis]SFW62177.1 hypothetical protein SAMN04489730_2094 [Amycolatopsis australiensis]